MDGKRNAREIIRKLLGCCDLDFINPSPVSPVECITKIYIAMRSTDMLMFNYNTLTTIGVVRSSM